MKNNEQGQCDSELMVNTVPIEIGCGFSVPMYSDNEDELCAAGW